MDTEEETKHISRLSGNDPPPPQKWRNKHLLEPLAVTVATKKDGRKRTRGDGEVTEVR